jgi:hypothetical protein
MSEMDRRGRLVQRLSAASPRRLALEVSGMVVLKALESGSWMTSCRNEVRTLRGIETSS